MNMNVEGSRGGEDCRWIVYDVAFEGGVGVAAKWQQRAGIVEVEERGGFEMFG